MSRLRFLPGVRYLHHGAAYLVRQVLADQHLLVENQSSGGHCVISQDDLTAAWATGTLHFEVLGPNRASHRDTSLVTSYTFADFHQLPEHVRDEAWRRYQLILPLLTLPAHERTRAFLEQYAASLEFPDVRGASGARSQSAPHPRVSRTSLQRWLQAFRSSGADLRSLVPGAGRQGGKGHPRLNATVDQIVQAVLDECRANPAYRTGQDVYFLVVNRVADHNRQQHAEDQIVLPSPSTIYRRINDAGRTTILRGHLSRAERRSQQPVLAGPTSTRILERVEIDHTVLDLFLVDEADRLPIGRPTLTTALDVYSGFPLGCYVGFEPPTYRAVMNCLLHSILPKVDTRAQFGTQHPWLAYGLPETLVVDHGPEFVGRDLQDACAQLGIVLEITPVCKPWFKGSVERYFRTANTGLIHSLPGTTFSNVVERDEYDPARHACLSLAAFWQLLHIFLLDIYAERWHDGVDGIPARRWAASAQSGAVPALHTSAEDVRMLLYHTETRTLQRYGVEVEALIYQSPALAQLRFQLPADQRIVRLKLDPGDLRQVHVLDPTGSGRWLVVPAIDQDYTAGLSLWKHRRIRRYVLQQQQTVDIYALADAKRRIQEIVEREFRLTRRSRTRKTAARLLDIGTGPAPSTGMPVRDPPLVPEAQLRPPPLAAAVPAEVPALAGFSGDFGLRSVRSSTEGEL